MGTIANNDNLYGVSKWIVNPVSGKGTNTTVQAAITAASAGDSVFIMPGTYTENITLKNGVNLCGLNSYGGAGERTVIVGKLIDNGVLANVTIDKITLKTNSDNLLAVTASGTTITCSQCRIDCSNNTGISVAAGTTVNLNNCSGDLGTTGIGYWTGAGTVSATFCEFGNSGSSLTASTTSGGVVLRYTSMNSVLSTSSTGAYTITNCVMDVSAINTTLLTTAGTGNSIIENSVFFTGTASSVSIGSGTTVKAYKCTFDSTNTNPVTGAGTYLSDETTYSNTGVLPNPTTETFAQVGRYGTWTPTLDGGTPGTTTYTTQVGQYHRIGNLVWIQGVITITAATGTGNAIIGSLPFTIKNVTSGGPRGTCEFSAGGWTWPAGTTMLTLQGTTNATTCTIIGTGSAVGAANLQMTNAAASVRFTMVYEAA